MRIENIGTVAGFTLMGGGLYLNSSSPWATKEHAFNAEHFQTQGELDKLQGAIDRAVENNDPETAASLIRQYIRAKEAMPEYVNSEFIDDWGGPMVLFGTVLFIVSYFARNLRFARTSE